MVHVFPYDACAPLWRSQVWPKQPLNICPPLSPILVHCHVSSPSFSYCTSPLFVSVIKPNLGSFSKAITNTGQSFHSYRKKTTRGLIRWELNPKRQRNVTGVSETRCATNTRTPVFTAVKTVVEDMFLFSSMKQACIWLLYKYYMKIISWPIGLWFAIVF